MSEASSLWMPPSQVVPRLSHVAPQPATSVTGRAGKRAARPRPGRQTGALAWALAELRLSSAWTGQRNERRRQDQHCNEVLKPSPQFAGLQILRVVAVRLEALVIMTT